jgi:hypothetical protein
MAGRYFNKASLFSLAAGASDYLLFGPESQSFGDISLWLFSSANVAWIVDMCDVNGSALGGQVQNGAYSSHRPEPVYTFTTIVPPMWRPRAKVTNSGATLVDITAVWVGLSYNPM